MSQGPAAPALSRHLLSPQIFNLMKYDSYSRFLKSDLFLKHQRTEEEEEEPPDSQTAAKRASRTYNT